MYQAINKRVPIIASDAGGIPLQVKHGLNGWVVPTSDSGAVGSLLVDIYTKKVEVKRDLARGRDLHGKTDPNSVAQAFVGGYEQPVPQVHTDPGSTSEDFWTVGNSTRWMLLFTRLLGLSNTPNDLTQDEGQVLQSMEASKELEGKSLDYVNVWKMVMGKDMLQGEGEIR